MSTGLSPLNDWGTGLCSIGLSWPLYFHCPTVHPTHDLLPLKHFAHVPSPVPPPPKSGGSGTSCCAHCFAYSTPDLVVGVPAHEFGAISMPETVAASVTVVN